MTKRVWHYFHESDPCCWFTNPVHVPPTRKPVTLCGSPVEGLKHTEDRAQVTCRTCFHRIVEMENPKELKR